MKKVKNIIFIFILFTAAFSAFAKKGYVKVVRDDVVLVTEFGTLTCPKGTVFTVIKKSKTKLQVKGKIFHTEVQGTISKSDVESIDEDSIKQTNSKSSSDATPKKLKYLGKTISQEFIDLFYESVINDYTYTNILDKNISLKKDLKTIESAKNLSELKKGDLVYLKGTIRSNKRYSIVKIYNEQSTIKNQYVLLVNKKAGSFPDQLPTSYKGLVCYRPDLHSAEITEAVLAVFRHMKKAGTKISKTDFINKINEGFKFQIRCEKCKGAGLRTSGSKHKQIKCFNCKGEGFLSPDKTVLIINNMLRAKRFK